MRLPRLTIRRMMAAVAIAAILISFERSRRVGNYDTALQRFEKQTVFYENGTIPSIAITCVTPPHGSRACPVLDPKGEDCGHEGPSGTRQSDVFL